MPTARDIALDTLLQWNHLQEPPFLPERTDENWSGLSPRDRAFAFDLLTGIFRWRNTLDAVIASRLRQPLETLDQGVRAILWLGAYQLLFQQTTDYAAVDTTVALAKKHRSTSKASGLVNAVLRGITRLSPVRVPLPADQAFSANLSRREFSLDFTTQLAVNTDLFPDPAKALGAHLAAVRSHPILYVEHLRRLFGDAQTASLLLRNNVRPAITLRVDADSLEMPTSAGLVVHATAPRFLVAADGWNPLIEQAVRDGRLSPQDPTAAAPVRHVAASVKAGERPAPARILDLCAGLGTKSLQLARAFPDAAVVATDVDTAKLDRLQRRAKDVGQRNISTQPITDLLALGAPHRFDWVLVDVPCSNTGVMAKRVQSRWRWPSLDHAALHTLQRKILAQGASLVTPGGILTYATCSIDPAENESIVRDLLDGVLKAEAGEEPYRLLHAQTTLPSLNSEPAATHDGGYFAVLSRPSVS